MNTGIRIAFALAAAMFGTMSYSIQAQAGWSNDPAVNTAIAAQAGADTNPALIDDGAGGAIITWQAPSGNIYAQRIDANGNAMWGADGIPVSVGGSNQHNPQLAADGSGGAFITWQTGADGSGNIYAQRVDADGNLLWASNGEIICNEEGKHQNPKIVSDGSGGAIIVWQDSRDGEDDYDIYAQRIGSDEDGDLEEIWGANGLPICTAADDQKFPQMMVDGSGGVFFVWQDMRLGKWKILAIRIDVETGSPATGWAFDGNPVSFSDQDHVKPQIISDGSGGAIITWQAGEDGDGGIYAQRIGGTGEYPWIGSQLELIVSTGQDRLQNPQIVSDGSGGAVIAWLGINSDTGASTGIFAQRVNGSGAAQWTTNGVTVASPAGIDSGDPPQMLSDGSNGAVVTWGDRRNGSDENIHAQRINGSGSTQWSENGAPVSTAANDQQLPRIISDGSGGFIVAWQDMRTAGGDIYAQKIMSDGTLPIVITAPTVTTAAVSAITLTSAASGGNVTSEGGASVTARGICWGLAANPETGPDCMSAGTGTGSFSGVISGLTPGTPYHVRAYATNSVGISYGDDLQFTTLAGSTLTVSLTLNGSATGRVTSDPAGIDCTTAQCSPVMFVADSSVTLTATPDNDSTIGWGGACVVADGKCTVTMSGDKSATATFSYVQPVRIEGSAAPYSLVGGAYAGLPDEGGTIHARVHEFTEELNLNRSLPVVFRGGYDTSYSGNSGITTVKGSITLTNGSLTVENLAIR